MSTAGSRTKDVVEAVTFETELKLRDRDVIKNSETETSKVVDFAEISQTNVAITTKLNFLPAHTTNKNISLR